MALLIENKEESPIDIKIDKHGILITTIEQSRESKGTWSEIYKVDDKYYNRVYADTQNADMVFIEELENEEEILKYQPNYKD